MRIVAACWLPYRLPLARPWNTAAGRQDYRDGWLLRLDSDDGRCGWGDCAPLPDFGIERESAARWAADCALLDLASQAAGQGASAWLNGGIARHSIAVNAALGDIQGLTPAAVAEASAAGYSTLKIKVGLGDPGREAEKLHALSGLLPAGSRLRLDANRAWTLAQAAAFLAACRDLPVDGVEEPLAAPDALTLRQLQADQPFALAVDESFPDLEAGFFEAPPVRRLILKPPRHGGLGEVLEMACRARQAGVECIVTSSLESACGLAAAAHLAAAVAPAAVHGLATADWFAADTGRPPPILAGRLLLPGGPGLGFSPGIS